MPYINVSTSAKVNNKGKLLEEISILISSLTNKSRSFVMAKIDDNCQIYFHLINIKKKLDIYLKKVKLLVNNLIMMIEFKRSKKNRSKNSLFNPYKNGISSYDMAYLSSKKILINKTFNLQNDFQKDNLAA